MSALELLRQIAKAQDVAALAAQGAVDALPAGELRYVLEYPAPPDLAEQHAAIAALLGTERFVLAPLAALDPLEVFLILRFPGAERVLPNAKLFEAGYALADGLALVSAEPDLGSDYFQDPQTTRAGERIETASLLGGTCLAPGDPPGSRDWALKSIGADVAWMLSPARGAGILIGQPDTGVVDHRELDAALRLDLAANILDPGTPPTDPLHPHAVNPGHGTGTASVAVSRPTGQITGCAPNAALVPIRCTSDVKIFDGAPVARAVAHATAQGCHVITMSLGGVPSRALHKAITAAIARDIIVLAAAGNCVRTVVWPARYSEVIAVAGTNIDDRPWRGSCRGGAVDIAAPAEFVWRAQRAATGDPAEGVAAGQGTSFAVALTAGAAALWLAAHGRDTVIATAQQRGVSVQKLFTAALRQSSRQPDDWDPDFGRGIVDAGALLKLPLNAIALVEAEIAPPGQADMRGLLIEQGGAGSFDATVDWPRYGLEVANIALRQAKFGASLATLRTESRLIGTSPSPALAARAAGSDDPRLRRIAAGAGAAAVRPPAVAARPQTGQRADSRIGQLLHSATKFENASGEVAPEQARAHLRKGGVEQELARASERLDLLAMRSLLGVETAHMKAEVMVSAQHALEEIADGRQLAEVSLHHRLGLEALVQLRGRPAIRIENGEVDAGNPELGVWSDRILLAAPFLKRCFAKVGRIDLGGRHIGTGFVVGPGLVLTNRHVLQELASPFPRRRDPAAWALFEEGVTIDFADAPTASAPAERFRVTDVIGAGGEPIDDEIEFTDLDAALLVVETTNAGGKALPEPVGLAANADLARAFVEIFTVGYPAFPTNLPADGRGRVRTDVLERLRALFGMQYGVKYFSPGRIDRGVGANPGDTFGWVVDHDATTLPGNSGSALFYFGGALNVVGLHFAGDWLRANFAHGVAAVRARNPLLKHPGILWV